MVHRVFPGNVQMVYQHRTGEAFGLRQSSGALAAGVNWTTDEILTSASSHSVGESGRGLPQSKTLRDYQNRWEVRQLLDSASPLALLEEDAREQKSGRGLPHSKTLSRDLKLQRRSTSSRISDSEERIIPIRWRDLHRNLACQSWRSDWALI